MSKTIADYEKDIAKLTEENIKLNNIVKEYENRINTVRSSYEYEKAQKEVYRAKVEAYEKCLAVFGK